VPLTTCKVVLLVLYTSEKPVRLVIPRPEAKSAMNPDVLSRS
jgi:hypothetical protein